MADEIVAKVRLDLTELDKDVEVAKAKGNKLIDDLEKRDPFSKSTKGAKELNTELNNLDSTGKKTSGTFGEMFKSFSSSALVVGAIAGIGAIVSSIGNKVIEVTAKYQKFEAVLTNTLGSRSQAQKAMKDILDFASRTPFQVDELTESFVKFANRGVKLTIAEMTKLGDIASSQGKSFNQLTEAILDAQTGEFERLKEFGIRASKEGDKVTLSFKGITKEVANNEDAIKNAIVSYGELEGVAGGMEAISKTLGGALSNMTDSFDKLFAAIGSHIGDGLSSIVNGFTEVINKVSDLIAVREDAIATGISTSFQNKQEAESAQALLTEYENLKSKGVNATANEKQRMTDITYQLKDSLGDSVVAINKETGALEVNTGATKQLIKQKILLSNTELAKVALEFNNAKAQKSASQAELKRITDARLAKKDALLSDEKDFGKRRAMAERESQSEFLNLKALRDASKSENERILKADETLEKTREELAKYGFKVEDFDFDTLAKSAIDTKKNVSKKVSEIDDKEASRIKKEKAEQLSREKKYAKDFEKFTLEQFEKESKIKQDAFDATLTQQQLEERAVKDKYFQQIEEAKQYGLDTTLLEAKRLEELTAINDKYQKEREDAEKKQADYQAKLDQESLDRFKKEQEAEIALIKSKFDLINEYASNGILLQIGLNPQDIARLSASVKSITDSIADGKAIDANQIAQTAGSTYFAVSNAIASAQKQRTEEELSELKAKQDEELRLAGDNEQKKEIIRQKYALKEKEVKRKQAEADKRKAIMDAVINTAVAVVKSLPNFVLAGIAGAIGAAQIALIAATPIPKFAKGGAVPSSDIQGMIDGLPHSAGGVLIEAEGNEFITRKSQAMKGDNLELLHAINMSDAERDKYINSHYVMPALQSKESKAKESYRHSIIEAENNLIARVSSHTLKSIHREQKNTTEAVNRLSKTNYNW